MGLEFSLRLSARLRDFFDRLNAIDSIPIALAGWELTGLDDEI